MRILVTGATGFVGSHLCRRLLSDGHEVYALVRNRNKFLDQNIPVKLILGDMILIDDWFRMLPEQIDCVIHLAAIVHAYESDPFFKINSDATGAFIERLKGKFPNLIFILLSSQAAGGTGFETRGINEGDPENPVSVYGTSKLKGERKLAYAPKSWRKLIIRPPMVIGPGDPAFVDVFSLIKKRIIPAPGFTGNKERFSFISVFDLVDFIIFALDRKLDGLYYSAHPETITYKKIIYGCAYTTGEQVPIIIPMPLNVIKIMAVINTIIHKIFRTNFRLTIDKSKELTTGPWVCDPTKSMAAGFVYKNDFNTTLSQTARDYQIRGWI